MKIEKISFKEYRNLKNAEVMPSDGINILCGNNAQGKTNFIEAIWLFTGGRSFRGSKDRDLVTFGQRKASIFVAAESFGRVQEIKIEVMEGKRFVTINKVPQRSASDLIGRLCAVVFSPLHLALIKDGPGVRRKFLDTAICQMQPKYTAHLLKYIHILNQRNSLLRHLKKSKNLDDTLDIWEEKLAEYGSELIECRFSYLEKLKELAAEFYLGLSSKKEKLSMQYKTTMNADPKGVLEKCSIKKDFLQKLRESREEDVSLGFTTRGPHRDEIEIKIDGKSARMFSSQGQQRSAVLAMKLAEAELVQQTVGETPVILMDDVLSELDGSRQNYLLECISEKQVFITCCEPEIAKRLPGGRVFEVLHGEIKPKC